MHARARSHRARSRTHAQEHGAPEGSVRICARVVCLRARRWDDALQCHLWGVADWCRLWDAVPSGLAL